MSSQKPSFQEPRFIICIKAVQCGPWEFCAACVDSGILSENSEDSHPSPTHGPGEDPVLSKATGVPPEHSGNRATELELGPAFQKAPV